MSACTPSGCSDGGFPKTQLLPLCQGAENTPPLDIYLSLEQWFSVRRSLTCSQTSPFVIQGLFVLLLRHVGCESGSAAASRLLALVPGEVAEAHGRVLASFLSLRPAPFIGMCRGRSARRAPLRWDTRAILPHVPSSPCRPRAHFLLMGSLDFGLLCLGITGSLPAGWVRRREIGA